LSGYPPEDLLFHNGLRRQVAAALERVRTQTRGIGVMIGYPEYTPEGIFNSAIFLRDGGTLANYRKQELPHYAVFDEQRYFKHGRRADGHAGRVAGTRRLVGAESRARGEGGRRAAPCGRQRVAVLARVSSAARECRARARARRAAPCRVLEHARRAGRARVRRR